MKKEQFYKCITFIKKCQSELIQTELYNIEKLKQEESQTVKSSFLNSINVSVIFLLKDFNFDLAASLTESFFIETDTASQNNK